MNHLPVSLFPYPYLPERDVKRVLSLFGPLTVFRPWFLDRPPSSLEKRGSGLLRILRPSEELRPKGDFEALLSRYKEWMKGSPDRSTIAFLKAGGGRAETEETTWKIRGAIRQRGGVGNPPEEAPALKWHLLLHLAQEVEDRRREASQALRALREKGSPLLGAVEEGDLQGPLADLPEFDADLALDEALLLQVYEAWFSLFGGHLNDHDLLVTTDRRLLVHLSDLWREYGGWETEAPELTVAFKFPDLSHLGPDEFLEARGRVDAKTAEIGDLVADLRQEPAARLSSLETWVREAEKGWPWDLSSGDLTIALRHFSPYPATRREDKGRLLKDLFGKTMILVASKETRHEQR